MNFESPEQIDQPAEQLSIGERVEGVVCEKGPSGEYVGSDAEGRVFIIPAGAGWEEGEKALTATLEVVDTAEDEKGNIRYIAKYIPE